MEMKARGDVRCVVCGVCEDGKRDMMVVYIYVCVVRGKGEKGMAREVSFFVLERIYIVKNDDIV